MAASLTIRFARLAALLCMLVAASLAFSATPAGATIVNVQTGSFTTATGNLTLSLPSASTSGTLLVAVISNKSNGVAFTAPSGWTQAITGNNSCCGRTDIWYYANNPGGITSATFSAASGSTAGQISEWNGVVASSALDVTVTASHGAATSLTLTGTKNATVANELGFTNWVTSGSNLSSFSASSGWAHIFNDLTGGRVGDDSLTIASGVKPTETETASASVSWMAAMATFIPSTCSGGSLGLTAPGSASFPSFTLDGTDQSATTTVTLKPDDETSGHSGWNLTETSTTFTDGSGHTLPTTATVTTAASTATTGGNCVMPTNSITYPVTLPAASTAPTAVKAYNAASATGQGPTNVTLTYQLSVPANAFHGTYTSTWTFAIVSGP